VLNDQATFKLKRIVSPLPTEHGEMGNPENIKKDFKSTEGNTIKRFLNLFVPGVNPTFPGNSGRQTG
jgi:hypothetical protein